MKIGVVGSGAIGGSFGTLLALDGHAVHFLIRSTHNLPLLQKSGWLLRLQNGQQLSLHPANFHTTPTSIGCCDVVMVCLKSTQNAVLPEILPPLIGPHTLLLTLQNGMGNVEFLAQFCPLPRILAGLCYIGANLVAPGQVHLFSPGKGWIIFCEATGKITTQTRAVASQFEKAGVRVTFQDSLDSALWHKLMWNIPFNGLTIAAGGIDTARLLACPGMIDEIYALLREVQSAAHHCGVTIAEEYLEKQITLTYSMGAYKPSSLTDYLAGKEVEINAIWAEPLRRGQAAGAHLPRLSLLLTLLRVLTERRP